MNSPLLYSCKFPDAAAAALNGEETLSMFFFLPLYFTASCDWPDGPIPNKNPSPVQSGALQIWLCNNISNTALQPFWTSNKLFLVLLLTLYKSMPATFTDCFAPRSEF